MEELANVIDGIFLRNTVILFELSNIIRFVKSLHDPAQSPCLRPARGGGVLQPSSEAPQEGAEEAGQLPACPSEPPQY